MVASLRGLPHVIINLNYESWIRKHKIMESLLVDVHWQALHSSLCSDDAKHSSTESCSAPPSLFKWPLYKLSPFSIRALLSALEKKCTYRDEKLLIHYLWVHCSTMYAVTCARWKINRRNPFDTESHELFERSTIRSNRVQRLGCVYLALNRFLTLYTYRLDYDMKIYYTWDLLLPFFTHINISSSHEVYLGEKNHF